MKILLVGGGSGGSVAPLLAVADEIKKERQEAGFLFVGGKTGPEKAMAEKAGLEFVAITSAKFKRYYAWSNPLAPFYVIIGFFNSLKILKSFRPDCVFGTGSFIQVPLVWAAKFLGIPVILHQQDYLAGLANKLCQFAAIKITVSFEESAKGFYSGFGIFYKKHKEKIILTGNPFREELKEAPKAEALKFFNLKNDLPVLLVLGGGTGAEYLNKLVAESLPNLTKFIQVIHSTGKGKTGAATMENYHPFEFIDHMAEAYAAADIVLARAGMSTITELSNLKKVSIIVPMPDSHQETNTLALMRHEAAIIVAQNKLTPQRFVSFLRKLLFEHDIQTMLKANIQKIMPHNAAQTISGIIIKAAEGL